jgi:hypothetical protein
LAALAVCSLASHATAHEDTQLQLAVDGTIRGLPPQYKSTRLEIAVADKTDGRPTEMTFTAGGKRTIIKRCVLERLPAGSWRQMSLSGSWYHGDMTRLPAYVSVRFETPNQSPTLPHPLGISFLFSLKDARLIVAQEALPTASEDQVNLKPVLLRAGCPGK